jgi:hypothetical protein
MNRRHFVKTTGVSLGGMLLAPASGVLCSCRSVRADRTIPDSIAPPDEVTAETEDGPLFLATSDRVEWSAKAVVVRMERDDPSLQVLARSPQALLKTITLTWKYVARSEAMYLGDAWERSYVTWLGGRWILSE